MVREALRVLEARAELEPLRVWATAINQLYLASRLSPEIGATLARTLELAGYREVREAWAECRTDALSLENMKARGPEPYGVKHTIRATLASRTSPRRPCAR